MLRDATWWSLPEPIFRRSDRGRRLSTCAKVAQKKKQKQRFWNFPTSDCRSSSQGDAITSSASVSALLHRSGEGFTPWYHHYLSSSEVDLPALQHRWCHWASVKEEQGQSEREEGEQAAYRYQMDAGKRSVLQQEHRHTQRGSECESEAPRNRHSHTHVRRHAVLKRATHWWAILRSFTVIH